MSSWEAFAEDNFADFDSAAGVLAAGSESSEHQQPANNDGDPWSTDAWGATTTSAVTQETDNVWADPAEFYSADSFNAGFDFTGTDPFDMSLDLFADPMQSAIMMDEDPQQSAVVPGDDQPQVVHIALHEELSSLYEGSEPPESEVHGSILVRPESTLKGTFCLVVKDLEGQFVQFQESGNHCIDISDSVPYSDLSKIGDKLLRVTVPPGLDCKQVTIASYSCGNSVHPVPLLVKCKVQLTKEFCRVGIKIRANPANKSTLQNGAILLAVPPDIKGESVKTSIQDTVWDGMKRLVAWTITELSPGQSMEVQSQFEFATPLEPKVLPRPNPKFPILVRFDGKHIQFSDVQLHSIESDKGSLPVKLKISRSVRVLHRKV